MKAYDEYVGDGSDGDDDGFVPIRPPWQASQDPHLKVGDAKRGASGPSARGNRSRGSSQSRRGPAAPDPTAEAGKQSKKLAEDKEYWQKHYRPTELIRNTARGPRAAEARPGPTRVGVPEERRVFKVQASEGRFSGWGALKGATIGSIVGGILLAGSVIAAPFTVGGSLVVGGACAAALSAFGGTVLGAKYGAARPQKAHLDAALRRLNGLNVRFTKAQAQNVAEVTDAQWRELLHVPKAMVAGRADRQRLRETLVLNVALHGFEYARQNKKSAMQAVTTGLIGRIPPDLEDVVGDLIDLEDGDQALDLPAINAIAQGLRDLPQGQVNEQTGWSQGFHDDVVDPFDGAPGPPRTLGSMSEWDEHVVAGANSEKPRPTVWLCHRNQDPFMLGDRVADMYEGQSASAQYKAFVGPHSKDQKVAKGLSHYINHNPLDLVGRVAGRSTNGSGRTIGVMEDDENPGDYIVRYEVGVSGEQDPVSMAISVKREDLAAGNGRFTWFEPPHDHRPTLPLVQASSLGLGILEPAPPRQKPDAQPSGVERRLSGASQAPEIPALQNWVSSVRKRRLTAQTPSNRSAASQRQQPPRLQRASTARPKPDQKSEPKRSPGLRATSMPGNHVMHKPLLPLKQTSPTIPETDDEDGPDA